MPHTRTTAIVSLGLTFCIFLGCLYPLIDGYQILWKAYGSGHSIGCRAPLWPARSSGGARFGNKMFADALSTSAHTVDPSASSAPHSTHATNGGVYDAQSITVLKGLEPVRKRPGMYIGSTGTSGLHHLVFEVLDNCVDEALAGYCTNITVTLRRDGAVDVQDNGRGIPCDLHPATGKSTLETVLCVLHAGGKFGGEHSGYKVSGGLHGVGLSVVNALSRRLEVRVRRGGRVHAMDFERGAPVTALQMEEVLPTASDTKEVHGNGIADSTADTCAGVDGTLGGDPPNLDLSHSANTGTTVTFYPDPLIFKAGLVFDFDRLAGRMDELAYLNPGLTITMVDERTGAVGCSSSSSGYSGRSQSSSSSTGKVSGRGSGNEDTVEELTDSVHQSSPDSTDSRAQTGHTAAEGGSASDSDHPQNSRVSVFRHDGGIAELVAVLCASKTSLFAPDSKTALQPPPTGTATVRIISNRSSSSSSSTVGETVGGGDVIYISGSKSNVVSLYI